MAATRQCACDDTQQFPEDQFRSDPNYGWVHDVEALPLHTIDGDTVWSGASADPGVDHGIPADSGFDNGFPAAPPTG